MEKLTLTEALVSAMQDQDDIDSTNAVFALRRAKDRVLKLYSLTGLATGIDFLEQMRDMDEIDDIIISVTMNGRIDLFR